MPFKSWVCLLLGSLTYGQAAQSPPPSATGANAGQPSTLAQETYEVRVGPDDPVITVNGFCTDPAQPASACKTVVTRAQFEALTEALQPGMSLSLRLNVANAYARNLRMSAAAEKRGLDKTPAFKEEMRYARMQLLAQDLSRALQADANNISDADLADYYKQNESAFEQATVARIFVPHARRIRAADKEHEDAEKKAAEDAMTKLAADLRIRAANGEDPDKLQIQAYGEAGLTETAPNTKMEKVRRTTLPPQHESALDLKPGEVSQVFSDPAGAHFIYKMMSKETLTLDEVRTELRTAISRQRYHDSMKIFQSDVVFSDAYFNPPGKRTAPPERNRGERRRMPSAESNQGQN